MSEVVSKLEALHISKVSADLIDAKEQWAGIHAIDTSKLCTSSGSSLRRIISYAGQTAALTLLAQLFQERKLRSCDVGNRRMNAEISKLPKCCFLNTDCTYFACVLVSDLSLPPKNPSCPVRKSKHLMHHPAQGRLCVVAIVAMIAIRRTPQPGR